MNLADGSVPPHVSAVDWWRHAVFGCSSLATHGTLCLRPEPGRATWAKHWWFYPSLVSSCCCSSIHESAFSTGSSAWLALFTPALVTAKLWVFVAVIQWLSFELLYILAWLYMIGGGTILDFFSSFRLIPIHVVGYRETLIAQLQHGWVGKGWLRTLYIVWGNDLNSMENQSGKASVNGRWGILFCR